MLGAARLTAILHAQSRAVVIYGVITDCSAGERPANCTVYGGDRLNLLSHFLRKAPAHSDQLTEKASSHSEKQHKEHLPCECCGGIADVAVGDRQSVPQFGLVGAKPAAHPQKRQQHFFFIVSDGIEKKMEVEDVADWFYEV